MQDLDVDMSAPNEKEVVLLPEDDDMSGPDSQDPVGDGEPSPPQ